MRCIVCFLASLLVLGISARINAQSEEPTPVAQPKSALPDPATVEAATEGGKKEAAAKDVGPAKMRMLLKNKLDLSGTPVELESVKINGLFGEASIPLATIAGIRFGQGSGEQSTVVLLNGDAITGELALTEVRMVADWGEARVFADHIVYIVLQPDLRWSSVQTPNGLRWRLEKAVSYPASGPVYNYNGRHVPSSQ